MAVVDKADREVVPELGVLLLIITPKVSLPLFLPCNIERHGRQEIGGSYGPISDGVTGSEGGGGRLISVGVVIVGE